MAMLSGVNNVSVLCYHDDKFECGEEIEHGMILALAAIWCADAKITT